MSTFSTLESFPGARLNAQELAQFATALREAARIAQTKPLIVPFAGIAAEVTARHLQASRLFAATAQEVANALIATPNPKSYNQIITLKEHISGSNNEEALVDNIDDQINSLIKYGFMSLLATREMDVRTFYNAYFLGTCALDKFPDLDADADAESKPIGGQFIRYKNFGQYLPKLFSAGEEVAALNDRWVLKFNAISTLSGKKSDAILDLWEKAIDAEVANNTPFKNLPDAKNHFGSNGDLKKSFELEKFCQGVDQKLRDLMSRSNRRAEIKIIKDAETDLLLTLKQLYGIGGAQLG